jgi:DNA-directed RNA polymerase specialized sigma24 family protein
VCGSGEDADDLVQATYARVSRRPRWVRYGSERAYPMRVLRNVSYDTLNSGTRRREVPAELEEVEFAADARAHPELFVATRAAYAAIAPEQNLALLSLDPRKRRTTGMKEGNA